MPRRGSLLVLVVLLVLLGWPAPLVVAASPAPAAAPEVVPGRLIVGLWSGSGFDDTDRPIPWRATSRLFPPTVGTIHPLGGATYRLELASEADRLAALAWLAGQPIIRYVEPDYVLTLHETAADLDALTATPNDPAFGQQDEMRRIEANRTWEMTTGRPEIILASLDTGVSSSHADLAGKLVSGFNFITNKAGGEDDQGHGTFTAALMAGIGNNKVGMAGVCWACRIMPVKILDKEGRGPSSAFTEAIRYAADKGARIVNVSAGGPGRSRSMEEAVDYASSKGVLVIASSGNTPNDTPNYPAAYEPVLAVAASGLNDNVTGFSTFGPFVDMAAPGINITSAARGSKDGVARGSGTSFSAPLVSGTAGLLLSLRPELTKDALANLLMDTAVDIGQPGRDDNFGQGRVASFDALLALLRPGPGGGATVQAASEGGARFRLIAGGFAPNERLRAWASGPSGRVAVLRGLIADGAGRLDAQVASDGAARIGATQLTLMGDQSRRVAVTPVDVTPAVAAYFRPVTGVTSTPDRLYFPETQHTLSGGFRAYWEANGGVAVFGFPISEEFQELNRSDNRTYTVQYFERNRFEYHPEHRGTAFEIQLGLLGSLLNGDRVFPTSPPVPNTADRRYFAETRHTLSADFRRFWEANGGLAIFGFPISEPFEENSRLVQYFERNRFELFPENPPEYRVQLGLLGRDLARRNGYIA